MIPVFKPSLGREEEQAVISTLRSNWLGNGARVEKFEEAFRRYIHAHHSVALNSASAALHLALVCLGLKKGDEVITPSLTFVATNHPILLTGATPVFCDIDRDTLCVDPEDIKRKITKKTKAIIVMHYGGHPVDLDPIIKLCRKYKIKLIEDCAHAEGTVYKGRHVGIFGDFACFSFGAIKNMTTGDGGMLIGKSEKDIDRAKMLAWSGIPQSTWQRMGGKRMKWEYNVVAAGWKYQMNDLAASIGLVQLKKLKANNLKRRQVSNRYKEGLRDVSWLELPKEQEYGKSAWHNFPIKVDIQIRDALSDFLMNKGVGTTVHYMPSHLYKLYSKYSAKIPVTNQVWKQILLLPMFPDLSLSDQNFIISAVKSFKNE